MKDYAKQEWLNKPKKKHGWRWIGVFFLVSIVFWYVLSGAVV